MIISINPEKVYEIYPNSIMTINLRRLGIEADFNLTEYFLKTYT